MTSRGSLQVREREPVPQASKAPSTAAVSGYRYRPERIGPVAVPAVPLHRD
jgi:hypothetical protein